MKEPSFSVVIPLYNKGPHIGRAVRSVLGQTFQDFELIIVDDASTDESLREVRKFVDPRIRLLHRPVPGPGGYAARNLGIRNARASWVSFLDADDTWETCYLECMRDLHETFPTASILCCGWVTVDHVGRVQTNPYLQKFMNKGRHEIDLPLFLESSICSHPPMWTSVVTMRRALLERIGGFPEGRCKRGGDIDTWLRAMLCEVTSAWDPVVGATYYRDAVNRVTQNNPHDLKDNCIRHTVRERLRVEREPGIRRRLKKFSNHYQMFGIKQLVKDGRLRRTDASTLYFEAAPLKSLLLTMLSLLPDKAQQKAARWYAKAG